MSLGTRWNQGVPGGCSALATCVAAALVGTNAIFLWFARTRPSFALIRRIYNFNTVLLPPLLLLVAALGFRRWRQAPGRRGWRLVSVVSAAIAVLAWLFRGYATHVEPNRLVLRRVSLQTEKLSRPLRILHITDIQSAAVGRREKAAFAMMRELQPDLVLHSGDLLQPLPPATFETELPKMAGLLRTLDSPRGIYGVVGDTDGRLRGVRPEDLGGLNILWNQEVVVESEHTRVRLFGLSCEASRSGADVAHTIGKWLASAPSADFTIVMGHAPDYALSARNLPVDLCLAGHTHGGQVRLPFFGPLVTLSGVPRAWARGFRQIGRTHLNVSAGIGSEHRDRVPPLRFACPPEMTLIDLVPKTSTSEPDVSPQGASQSPIDRATGFFRDNFPRPRMTLIGGPIAFLWAYGCLWFAGYLKRSRGWRTGYTRKIFHFMIFASVAAIHGLWGTRAVCLFGGMTTLIVFYAVYRGAGHPLYEAVAREKDAPHRTYFVMAPYFATLIGGLTSNILFGDAALFGYLVTGLGDAVGEPVGTRFGRHTYRVPSFGGVPAVRSYEGSGAVFVACMLALLTGIAMSPGTPGTAAYLLSVPFLAFGCTLLEAISPHGWDNAVLQIVASSMVHAAFGGIGI